MEKLIKKLTLVGKVNTNSLNIWWDIYDYILKEKLALQDYYLRRNNFDVTNEDEWITFDDCRDIEIKIENNTLCAYCKAYDKETYYNELPTFTHKWGIKLTLPMEFIKKFEIIIDYQFEKFCENSYKEYLETMKLQWIKNFKEEMLG